MKIITRKKNVNSNCTIYHKNTTEITLKFRSHIIEFFIGIFSKYLLLGETILMYVI